MVLIRLQKFFFFKVAFGAYINIYLELVFLFGFYI